MNRKAAAVIVIALWIAGIAWLMNRNFGGDVSRRLTEAAIRIEPGTHYYDVTYRGEKIGSASSSIDTLPSTIATDDYFTGSYPFGDSLVPVNARIKTRMNRALRLSYVTVDFTRAGSSSKMGAFVDGDSALVVTRGSRGDSAGARYLRGSTLIAPSLIGIALILGEPPKVGRAEKLDVFDPVSGTAGPRLLRIAAESVFTVADSAGQNASGGWEVAHSDTVRAWRIAGDVAGFSVWVDAQGRLMSAVAPNGVTVSRTAFELAFPRGAAPTK